MSNRPTTPDLYGYDSDGQSVHAEVEPASVTRSAARNQAIPLVPPLQSNPRRRANTLPRQIRRRSDSLSTVPEDLETNEIITDTPASSVQSLLWDDHVEPLGNSTVKWSTSTGFEVSILSDSEEDEFLEPLTETEAMDAQVKQHRGKILNAEFVLQDDIRTIYFEKVTVDHIKDKLVLAEACKKDLQSAQVFLSTNDDEHFTANLKENVVTLRANFVKFITDAQAFLQAYSTTAQQAPTKLQIATSEAQQNLDKIAHDALEARRARVLQFNKETNLELTNLLSEVTAVNICIKAAQTDSEVLEGIENLTLLEKRSHEVIEDATSMANDALTAALQKEALDLETGCRNLKKMLKKGGESLKDAKTRTGIQLNPDGSLPEEAVDLKPPEFYGDSRDKLDYYEFSKEWMDYIKSKKLSKENQLKVLKKTSLQGPAHSACKNMDTLDKVWEYLKNTYGNPSILFALKIEDIKKLGPCNGSQQKKRDWTINAISKLNGIHDLCKQHDLLEDLYHSAVVSELRNFLPYKPEQDFRKKLRKDRTPHAKIPKKDKFEKFKEFLQELCEDLTFDIDLDASDTTSGPSDTHKKHEKADNSKQKKSQHNSQPSNHTNSQQSSQQSSQPQAKPSKQSKNQQTNKPKGKKPQSSPPAPATNTQYEIPTEVLCQLCNGFHTHLYYCKQFLDATTEDRWNLLSKLKCCARCLRMDSNYFTVGPKKNKMDWWNGHQINCKTKFPCQVDACSSRTEQNQFNIVMCRNHVDTNKKDNEEKFIKELDSSKLPSGVSTGAIKLFYTFSFNNKIQASSTDNTEAFVSKDGIETIPDVKYPAIYMLQNLLVNDEHELLLFYDTGCSGASISDKAYSVLETRTVREGPTSLHVAGNKTVDLDHGDEQFCLDMYDEKKRATITALRMPKVTSTFPMLKLQEAFEDIQAEYKKTNPKTALPKVDISVGGSNVDIMMGIRYLKHFPQLVYHLPSGLSIYKAQFKSVRGCQGILGGPHPAWQRFEDSGHHMNPKVYLLQEARAYLAMDSWAKINQDKFNFFYKEQSQQDKEDDTTDEEDSREETYPQCPEKHCTKHQDEQFWMIPKHWNLNNSQYSIATQEKEFWGAEELGSNAPYRCIKCRNCGDCKKSEELEEVSLKEEQEQVLIESSVVFNYEQKKLVAKLPFIKDPNEHLKPNSHIAFKILSNQMKLYEKYPSMRQDTLTSHAKLVDRGHVSRIEDLSKDEREKMESVPGPGYVIPWRTVYKADSLSTPCRMVYDASSKTPDGDSLNGVLAKGQNKLASLQQLILRFKSGRVGMTADISMAYNGTKLCPTDYKWQQYLWKPDLDPREKVIIMIIKTLIYGVKSAGGQTGVSIKKLADYWRETVDFESIAAAILCDDTYVDDIISALESLGICRQVAEEIIQILGLGSMAVKAFTFSSVKPSEEVSADGVSVGLGGYLWQPVEDTMSIDVKELCLQKAKRGKPAEPVIGDFGEALKKSFTRRVLVGQAAKVFDPIGLATPFTARLKLDLHKICRLGLGWDEPIPEDYLETWVQNLHATQELKQIRFQRTIIPPDAINTDVHLLVAVDASQDIAISAVYARVQRITGDFSCQLLFGRSKLVSGSTIPRAELKAAVMGTVSAHILKKNLGKKFHSIIYMSDSTIFLHWLNQDERPLQVAVRNGVIEVRRFSMPEQWYHVESEENIADLGTRKADIKQIAEGSEWQTGKPWMKGPVDSMPLKKIQEVTLTGQQKKEAAQEMKSKDLHGYLLANLKTKVSERYSFSKYLYDPCKYQWSVSVRILAIVFKFIHSFKVMKNKSAYQPNQRVAATLPTKRKKVILLSDIDIQRSKNYYFKVGSKEVKQFCKQKEYKDISVLKEDILYYSGRILEDQDILAVEKVMFDVEPLQFCQPILDRHSPIAYAIMMEAHGPRLYPGHSSDGVNHKNTLVTLRESMKSAFILKGRDLAKEIRESCVFCRRFRKRFLEVEMGKVHQNRFTIAPPFYFAQVDLLGPYLATCEHNHRSSVKVWGVVFKDPATSAVFVHAMPKCDTSAFILAYTRFAARFGHPAKLYPDEGSQLLKACREMQIHWVDVAKNLNSKYQVGVEFSPCPVGGHNAHGMVERSVQEVKKLFNIVYSGLKLDILSYETAFAWVSNELNNLPVCLGSKYENMEHLDLITPARLIHGRASNRAMSGCCTAEMPSKVLDQMDLVFESWWKCWKDERLPLFVASPKMWKETGYQPKLGDIVVFPKEDKEQKLGEPIWRLGRVVHLEVSDKDKLIRNISIEYRNSTERTFRKTRRAVRTIAVLHKEDQLELVEELNQAAQASNLLFCKSSAAHDKQSALQREFTRYFSYLSILFQDPTETVVDPNEKENLDDCGEDSDTEEDSDSNKEEKRDSDTEDDSEISQQEEFKAQVSQNEDQTEEKCKDWCIKAQDQMIQYICSAHII